jgi:hypothetical protein
MSLEEEYTIKFKGSSKKGTKKNIISANIMNGSGIAMSPIPYSPSDKLSTPKSGLKTMSTPGGSMGSLRHRSNFQKNRLKTATDEASYFKDMNRKLRMDTERLRKVNQSLTTHIAFGNNKRPETPRSESRTLGKSPMRRKGSTRVRKKLHKDNDQFLFMIKGVVAVFLLYLLWKEFVNVVNASSSK